MKPYSRRKLTKRERIFNYCLSRARRISENAFGILAWRFHIFPRPIDPKVETADSIVWVACLLHNWLRQINPANTISLADMEDPGSGDIIDGAWREVPQQLRSVSTLGSSNYSKNAEEIRHAYADYFMNNGAIPWQWKRTDVCEYSDGEECFSGEDLLSENEDNM